MADDAFDPLTSAGSSDAAVSPILSGLTTLAANAAPPLADADFRRVADVLKRHAGIHLADDKRELVRSRLAKRLRALGYSSYRQYLEDHVVPADRSGQTGGEFVHFVDVLSTNLTSFYREPAHFDYLRRHVLPGVLARSGGRVRGWCAAASTGEEPYCLAMTCLEAAREHGVAKPDVKVLSTDICTKVLAEASAGVYAEPRAKAVNPALRGRYWEPRRLPDGMPAIAAGRELRDACVFRRLNLMDRPPFRGPLDFIFCRNVMIYFDRPTRESLVGRLLNVLAPGGYLFTGHSESLTGTSHALRQVQAAVYQKPS